jgi:enterochelin esterase-like enzyme
MPTRLLLWIGFFLLLGQLTAQGTLHSRKSIKSPKMGYDVNYSVYLPEGYDRNDTQYPVLYLLHGYTDDDSGWTQFGEAHLIADRLMGNGEVPPMIIVMPDAKVTWYINDDEGKAPYEDFFIQELIPHVEKTYRARVGKQFRAVAGLSMGGYGSLIYALKHPDMFAACAPLSAAVYEDEEMLEMEQAQWDYVFGPPLAAGLEGAERLNEHYYANSPLHIVRNGEVEALRSVKYYIDCGDDDFLIKGNMELHAAMIDQEIEHEFRVRDGGHTWTYWRTALPEVLAFVGQSFRR